MGTAYAIVNLGKTGLLIGQLTMVLKTVSGDVNVSQVGMTLTERGNGRYKLTNPNIAEDSDFYVYETNDPSHYAFGIFSLADGDMARNSTSTQILNTLAAVGGLTGAHKVTLQIYETATVIPIADVLIDVYDSTNTSHMNGTQFKTGANGQVEFNRDDGTYKIRMMKAGVTFSVGTVTVAGADKSETFYGTSITIAAPSTGNACRVYEYCFMPDDATPMTSTSVVAKARIKSLPYDYNGKYHSGQEIDGIYNAVTGVVYWDLVYGALVEFNIKHIHNGWTPGKTIPTTGTVRLKEIA